MDIGVVISLSLTLFLILDPFASVPMFINVTEGLGKKEIASYANKAVLVAAALLFIFIFFGDHILDLFGVTIDTFRVAGGIIFFMMAIEMVFGLKLSKSSNSKGARWAIIASPVLTGPGVISAAVLSSAENGIETVFIASVIALFSTWVVLRLSPWIMEAVGEQALGIMTKVMGLFIASMGIQSIFDGTLNWYEANRIIENMVLSAAGMF